METKTKYGSRMCYPGTVCVRCRMQRHLNTVVSWRTLQPRGSGGTAVPVVSLNLILNVFVTGFLKRVARHFSGHPRG